MNLPPFQADDDGARLGPMTLPEHEHEEHPLLMNEEGVDTEDQDPSNMMLRAGYLVGMSMKLEDGDDRRMLQRAARSLAFAAKRGSPT